jgi:hypothetical protein
MEQILQLQKQNGGDFTVYIAGPMSGKLEFNYPAFYKMAEAFKKIKGIHVKNPATIANGVTNLPYDYYIREALYMVVLSNAMIMLDGWKDSRGAKMEYHVARTMGIPVFDESFNLIPENLYVNVLSDNISAAETKIQEKDNSFDDLYVAVPANKVTPTKAEPKEKIDIFEEARKLIHLDRQKQYGSPKKNFTDIGRGWGMMLDIPDIKPETVALMMALLKITREKHKHKDDNLTDGAGYLGIAQGIHDDIFQ